MNIINNGQNIVITEDSLEKDSLYVYLLQLNKIDGTIENRMKIREDEDVVFENSQDGFYIIGKVEIPIYDSPYYYDDGKFYYNEEEVGIQDILDDENITKEYQNYFQLYNLKQCYISICQQIFNSRGSIKCSAPNIDQNLIYKRDLIWMTINVIKFMIETNRWEEAERLLERITECNGLCNNNLNHCGCGMRM